MNELQVKEIFGDHEVVPLLVDLWDLMQIWDDAQDGDKNDFAKGYEIAVIKLQNSHLYHQLGLQQLVNLTYYKWFAANQFEENKEELNKAYMLRAGWYDIVLMVVHSVFGTDKAKELAPIIYKCYGEKFEDYKLEIENA